MLNKYDDLFTLIFHARYTRLTCRFTATLITLGINAEKVTMSTPKYVMDLRCD